MNTLKSNKGFQVPASRNAGPDWTSTEGHKAGEATIVRWYFKGEDRGWVFASHYEHRRQTRKEAWGC